MPDTTKRRLRQQQGPRRTAMHHLPSQDHEEHDRVEAVYRRWYAYLARARRFPPGLPEHERKPWLKRLIVRHLSELRAHARRCAFVIEGAGARGNVTISDRR